MKPLKSIEADAAAWCAREDRGLTATERASLQAWLDEAVTHRIAYLRIKSAWQQDVITEALVSVVTPSQQQAGGWSFPAIPRWAVVASLPLCVVVGGGYFWMSRPVVYATDIGEQSTIHLADGSQVELNTNTRLRSRIWGGSRTITVEQGEAYFHVAHDPKVPFVVYVGSQKVSDIGTQFLIRRDGAQGEILVTEGVVRVENRERTDAQPRIARANDDIHVNGDSVVASKTSEQQIADRLSWRDGVLVFNEASLADVAAEFNRYNKKHIVVVGDARNRKIGGRFRPDNLAGFVALLQNSFGLSVQDTGETFVISK